MRSHDYWVYILTNKHCTTLYFGITKNHTRRLSQHRCAETDGFTKRYRLNRLVWFEYFRNVNDAIRMREEVEGLAPQPESLLIEQTNPRWLDWSEDWEQQPKMHDPPWETEEIIRDSSLRSE